MQKETSVITTLKQSRPRLQSVVMGSRVPVKASLRDMWEEFTLHHDLHPRYTNSKQGKQKTCCILIDNQTFAEAHGSTWDQCLSKAIYIAMEKLEPQICQHWKRIYPSQAAKIA